MAMERLDAQVEGIVYRSDDTGYTVAEVSCGRQLHTVVGTVPQLSEGMRVVLHGEWTSHAAYGRQFKIATAQIHAPQDIDGVQRYLASGIVSGVGAVTASRIVETFGAGALDVIRYQPHRLSEVPGIGTARAQAISEGFAQHYDMQGAMVFLQSLGITPGYAMRIYKQYGAQTQQRIQANPYDLVWDVEGIGFRTADRIARALGQSGDAPQRARAALVHVLREAQGDGHACLPMERLVDQTTRLLSVPREGVEQALSAMVAQTHLVLHETPEGLYVWLPTLRYAERDVALRILQLSGPVREQPFADMDAMVADMARRKHIELAPEQREAVLGALLYGVSVITGGPGTGKTTAINCLIGLLEAAGLRVQLAAPTGRAAKRMGEATGCEAKTLHRLLEYSVDGAGGELFRRNEDNPLEADAIIIDEMSMVDVLLMQRLLKAVPPGARLVLVGDADQLPSVGPGSVLRDIIGSGFAYVARLTQIFRQAQQSMIVTNAHRVNAGQMPQLNARSGDFFFERRNTPADVLQSVLALVGERLPKYAGYDPLRDIQVLTPMRKGDLGVESLNERLQAVFNPPDAAKAQCKSAGIVLREGDKVMQIKNNYTLEWQRLTDQATAQLGEGVYNGDMGFITRIDNDARLLCVHFDDQRLAEYEFNQLDELALAYAISIHKSQGSEFPVVVLPLLAGPPMLLSRNLLYTAITRARELVVITGREACIAEMVANNRTRRRYSGLGWAFAALAAAGGTRQ